jgi:hypothetical protein
VFKFLLAFLVWLFATGKYQDWIALATSSGGGGGSSGTGGTGSASANGAGGILSGLGSLGSLSGNSTTDAQLLGPASFSPADSGVPK